MFIRRLVALGGSLLASLSLAIFLATPASASLFVVLEPASGPPGTAVSGRTAGDGAFATTSDTLPTYLVAAANADAVTRSDDPNLVAVGELDVDAAGNGRISFVVPPVAPGDYVVMVSCPPCAPTSAGRTMLPVAGFRVSLAVPATDTVEGSPDTLVVTFGAVFLTSLLVALRFHGRSHGHGPLQPPSSRSS